MALGTRTLSGPRLPAARGTATHLIILCHGYGADGNDLIGLAPFWQRLMPTAAFVAPNAPERCPGSPGYQWFPISRLDPADMQRGVESAAAALESLMSLHVGLRRARKPAAIVGFSGLLAGTPPSLGPDTPPILLVHGDADPMIPVEAMFESVTALGKAGAAVQWHISPGVGHSIDEQGLVLAGGFLAMAFRGILTRRSPEVSCPLS